MDGEPDLISKNPWLASIEVHGRHACNAVIINNHWALTARDCVDDDNEDVYKETHKVRVGTDKTGEGGRVHKVDYFLPHPRFISFHGGISKNNLGLIRVKEPFWFGTKIFPIQIYESEESDVMGKVSGFGDALGDVCPKRLQTVEVPLLDLEVCEDFYGRIPDASFCAGYAEPGGNACNRDRGAPLVLDGKLLGIAIHGNDCDLSSKKPVLFLEVYEYSGWISLRTLNLCNCTSSTNL